jgi:hypothetical protein
MLEVQNDSVALVLFFLGGVTSNNWGVPGLGNPPPWFFDLDSQISQPLGVKEGILQMTKETPGSPPLGATHPLSISPCNFLHPDGRSGVEEEGFVVGASPHELIAPARVLLHFLQSPSDLALFGVQVVNQAVCHNPV